MGTNHGREFPLGIFFSTARISAVTRNKRPDGSLKIIPMGRGIQQYALRWLVMRYKNGWAGNCRDIASIVSKWQFRVVFAEAGRLASLRSVQPSILHQYHHGCDPQRETDPRARHYVANTALRDKERRDDQQNHGRSHNVISRLS